MRSVLAGGGTTRPAAGSGGGVSPAPAGQGRRGSKGKLGPQHADVIYLWTLLGLELLATAVLRNWSRNHHGG